MSNAPLLPEASDRRALTGFAWDLLRGQPEDEAFTGGVLHLEPGGEALLALVTNRDPERTGLLMSRLPESVQRQMNALNPAAHDLSGLTARLILLHGRGDNVIPYTQTQALAAAVESDQARLFLIDGLAHVELKPKRRDLPVLLEFVELVLSERAKTARTGLSSP